MLKLIDSNEICRKKIAIIYKDIGVNLSSFSIHQLEDRIRKISSLAIKILNSKE